MLVLMIATSSRRDTGTAPSFPDDPLGPVALELVADVGDLAEPHGLHEGHQRRREVLAHLRLLRVQLDDHDADVLTLLDDLPGKQILTTFDVALDDRRVDVVEDTYGGEPLDRRGRVTFLPYQGVTRLVRAVVRVQCHRTGLPGDRGFHQLDAVHVLREYVPLEHAAVVEVGLVRDDVAYAVIEKEPRRRADVRADVEHPVVGTQSGHAVRLLDEHLIGDHRIPGVRSDPEAGWLVKLKVGCHRYAPRSSGRT